MNNGRLYKGGYTIYDYKNHVIAVNSNNEVAHYDNETQAHREIDEELKNSDT